MKLNIKKDRIEIARIIDVNLELMNKNHMMCQEVADAIMLYLIEKEVKKMEEEFNFDGEDEKIASQGDYGNALKNETRI